MTPLMDWDDPEARLDLLCQIGLARYKCAAAEAPAGERGRGRHWLLIRGCLAALGLHGG